MSCGATACPGCATATARRASRSAMSGSDPASSSTSTSRSWAGSPTAAVTACAAGRPARPGRVRGYDYVHAAIDDMSRVAYVDVLADERGPTCARFLRDAAAFFARQGVRIERVMTDNAKNYTLSPAFQAALVEHRRAAQADPRRTGPRPTARAERFNRTLLDEWAYAATVRRRTTSACSCAARLRRALQQPSTPHRAERAHADGGPCQQRVREFHLGPPEAAHPVPVESRSSPIHGALSSCCRGVFAASGSSILRACGSRRAAVTGSCGT